MRFLREWGRTAAGILLSAAVLFMGCYQLNQQLAVWNTDERLGESQTGGTHEIRKNHTGFLNSSNSSIKSVSKDAKYGPGSRMFQGGTLTMLENQTSSQMLSIVLETRQGEVMVFDGGTPGDAGHLLETLRGKGGHVSAWFITHPHSDHVGALTEILNNPTHGLAIDHIYYSFAGQEWYEENEQYRADMVAQAVQAFQSMAPERLHGDIFKDQTIQIGEATVTVMNQPYLYEHNSINNSSVVYKVEMEGSTILILGDLGPEAGDQLLDDCGSDALKADIVQMAHHGQNGVSKEVYKAIAPQVCLWPTPSWLWSNDNSGRPGSGPWSTQQTIRWMSELGVVANYSIKDGDQIIE